MQEEAKGTVDSELATVLSSIALACKQIASLVNRAGVSNLTGAAGLANASVCSKYLTFYWQLMNQQRLDRGLWCEQGEDQKKLDVVSNDVFCNALRSCGRTGTIASEEEDVPIAVEETNSGKLL